MLDGVQYVMLEASGELGAHALLDGLYHLLARHCGVHAHRENVMRGLAAHLVRRFGASAVPQDLRAALPGLVAGDGDGDGGERRCATALALPLTPDSRPGPT